MIDISVQKSRTEVLNNFRNFCAFISSEEEINIVTSKDPSAYATKNSIYVPDTNGLTVKQVTFVYSSVLHEFGHIKHTNFDKSYFSQLYNGIIAQIANFLEDARSESLLCDEFSGASDIFTDSIKLMIDDDPEIVHLFGSKFSDIDFFNAFGIWLYIFCHRGIKISESYIIEKIPPAVWKEVDDFLTKGNFRENFKNISKELNTQDDVLLISNMIHDLLLRYYPEENNTAFFPLESFFEVVNNAKEVFNDVKTESKELILNIQKAELEATNKKINNEILLVKIKRENSKNEKSITAIHKQIVLINKKQDNLRKIINIQELAVTKKDVIENSVKTLNIHENKIHIIDEKKKDTISDLNKLTAKMNEIEPVSKNTKKIEALQKRIGKKNDSLIKVELQKSKIVNNIDKFRKNIKENVENFEKISKIQKDNIKKNKNLKSMTKENINLEIENLEGNIKLLQIELENFQSIKNTYMYPYYSVCNDIIILNMEINFIFTNLKNIIFENYSFIQNSLLNHGIQKSILPVYSFSNEWNSMSKLQIKQDKLFMDDCGSFIFDGLSFCFDIENTQETMNKIEEKINSIDPIIEFKRQYATCISDKYESDINQAYLLGLGINEENIVSLVHKTGDTTFDKVTDESNTNALELKEFNKLCNINEEKIETIIDSIEHSFKPKKRSRWIDNQESGKLDNRALWKLPAGISENIFEYNSQVITQSVCATILIDLSFSVGKNNHAVNDIKIFTKALSDALNSIEVSHEIIGYYAEVSPEMIRNKISSQFNRREHSLTTEVFKNFNQNNNSGISNIRLHLADNCDGESLKIAIQRLKRQPEDKHIIFLLSDFLPHLINSSNKLLDKDFESAVKNIHQNGAKIFGFNTCSENSNPTSFPQVSIDGISNCSVEELFESDFFDFLASMRI